MPVGWLWQGHVFLVVIGNDAEGNKYCHYEVTAKVLLLIGKRGYVFFFGRGDSKKI